MSTDTRTRMVAGAAKALATGGIDAMSLRALAEREGIPLGSTYHHFPGGKAALAQEAVRYVGAQVTQVIESGRENDPAHVLEIFVDRWRRILEASDYRSGCPVAAAATARDPLQHAVAREVFSDWQRALTDVLVAGGVDTQRAPGLASTILSAVEGALAVARAVGTTKPLDDVVTELGGLLAQATSHPGPKVAQPSAMTDALADS